MEKSKVIDVWHGTDCEWVDYTYKELDEYFHFVNKPDWNQVREIYLNGSGSNMWMRIIPKEGFTQDGELIYNKVHGTYVEILD